MMTNISKIIIIGTNHHNTLSMVRSFGEEGLHVVLYIYGTKSSYVASSIYVDSVLFFDSAFEAVNSILSITNEFGKKPLVIACSDDVSSLMDSHFEEFIEKCYFFNASEAGRINLYMDKQKQLNLAKKCGFYTPTSIDILPKNINPSNIHYPCFIKPKISIYGGKNISICKTSEDLTKAIEKYNPKYNILIQDYINKEYEIVVLGLSIKDVTIIPGFIQKHREEQGGTTYSTTKPISDLDQRVIKACELLIKEIRYQGLWGIECIKQGDRYFFLELNMRNDATSYAMKVAGVNLPYLYLQFIENPNFIPTSTSVTSINSMVEFNDFNFVLKREIGLFKWFKEYKNAECKYYYSIEDRKPYRLKKREYIKFLRTRIFRF